MYLFTSLLVGFTVITIITSSQVQNDSNTANTSGNTTVTGPAKNIVHNTRPRDKTKREKNINKRDNQEITEIERTEDYSYTSLNLDSDSKSSSDERKYYKEILSHITGKDLIKIQKKIQLNLKFLIMLIHGLIEERRYTYKAKLHKKLLRLKSFYDKYEKRYDIDARFPPLHKSGELESEYKHCYPEKYTSDKAKALNVQDSLNKILYFAKCSETIPEDIVLNIYEKIKDKISQEKDTLIPVNYKVTHGNANFQVSFTDVDLQQIESWPEERFSYSHELGDETRQNLISFIAYINLKLTNENDTSHPGFFSKLTVGGIVKKNNTEGEKIPVLIITYLENNPEVKVL